MALHRKLPLADLIHQGQGCKPNFFGKFENFWITHAFSYNNLLLLTQTQSSYTPPGFRLLGIRRDQSSYTPPGFRCAALSGRLLDSRRPTLFSLQLERRVFVTLVSSEGLLVL